MHQRTHDTHYLHKTSVLKLPTLTEVKKNTVCVISQISALLSYVPGKDTRLNAMQSCGVPFHLQSGHSVAESKRHKMLAQATEAMHTYTYTIGLGAMTSKKIFLEWRTQVPPTPPPAWHQIVLAAWLKFLPTPASHQNTSYFGYNAIRGTSPCWVEVFCFVFFKKGHDLFSHTFCLSCCLQVRNVCLCEGAGYNNTQSGSKAGLIITAPDWKHDPNRVAVKLLGHAC